MSGKKKWLFYILFFTVLITGFLFFVLKDYDWDRTRLPVLNPEIPAFSFTSEEGKQISQYQTDGKVYAANYFFTTCRGICPKMNANMRVIYDEFKDNPDFLILSHTCMPETDSIPQLSAYEKLMLGGKLIRSQSGDYSVIPSKDSNNFENKSWYFLTGPKVELYRQARNGYLIDNREPDSTQNISAQFIHTQFFALIDRQRRLRGIYDGLKESEVKQMIKDIKYLLKEKVKSKHFMNGFSNNPS